MNKNILIIDDDEQIRSLLYQILKGEGYQVFTASDGSGGLKLFYERPVDLVITDMVMPEKMGIDVILELREKFPKMKVIAISGGGAFGPDIELDMAKTLDAYTIEKPFSPKDIIEAVAKLTTEDHTEPMEDEKQVIPGDEDTLKFEKEFIDQEISLSKNSDCTFGVLTLQVSQSVSRGLSKLLPEKVISFHPFEKEILQNDGSIINLFYRKYYLILPRANENDVRRVKDKIFELAKLHKLGDVFISAAVYPKDGKTSCELIEKIS